MFIIDPYRFGAPSSPLTNSLSFTAASSQYLSKSNADWGAYNGQKFAIAGSFRIPNVTGNRTIMAKSDGTGRELALYTTGSKLYFEISGSIYRESPSSSLTGGAFYAFLIYYDSTNASSDARIRMWINGTEQTTGAYSAPAINSDNSDTKPVRIGYNQAAGGEYMDGFIYSLSFFNNALPTSASVFSGGSGKVQELSLLSGLKSLLTASTATDDHVLTDWTNNGTVTTSATVP